MYTVLVCDDDKDIVDAIATYLKMEGYNPLKAYDGKQVLKILEERSIHLLLMDVMMPVMDGIEALGIIRQSYNIPVILVSAKSEDFDKIMGLSYGADDYVTKPFNPLELMARVKSQMRRYTNLGSLLVENNILKSGGLSLNTETKEIYVDGETIVMTPTEYKIIHLLIKSPGRVFSIQEIYENVWHEDAIGAENTVAVHIRRIREKLEINPKDPKYLKVVWGIGYKIEKYSV